MKSVQVHTRREGGSEIGDFTAYVLYGCPLMKQGEFYIKHTGDFLAKLKAAGEVPEGAILVTADVVGLYPSIPHSEGLDILKKQYENYPNKKVSTEDIGKMADFVLKNNLFEFDSNFYKQISGTAIGTKLATPYACIFMNHIETDFLKMQDIKQWFWKRFIDDIFFIWTESEESLEKSAVCFATTQRTSIGFQNLTKFLFLYFPFFDNLFWLKKIALYRN